MSTGVLGWGTRVGIGVAVVLLALWGLPLLLLWRNQRLLRDRNPATPAALGLAYEPVAFASSDGVRLAGWFLPGDPGRLPVIVCHGLGASKADVLGIAGTLSRQGFSLFLFDFRAHGASAGTRTSFGSWEQRDLEGALHALSQRVGPGQPVGILGISMGAAVAITVGAREPRLAAVVADSSYRNLEAALAHTAGQIYGLSGSWVGPWLRAAYGLLCGVDPRRMAPDRAIAAWSPRPVLLIHSAGDPQIPVADAHALYEAAREPKRLWVVPAQGHLASFAADPAAYGATVGEFFGAVRATAAP